jgi:selenocysteine lyase/cysteine desulfurase
MRELDVSAAALGNHEFDWGIDTLRARLAETPFAALGANVRTSDGQPLPWLRDDTVVVRGGLRIGIVGVADPATGALPVSAFEEVVGPRTRLVAVTAGSNAIGTIPDVAAIAALARGVGALTYVDGVHATPHLPVDVTALGADFYMTSAYKWSGPHIAAVVAAPSIWSSLMPDKLMPSPDSVPDRFEFGTMPFELLAGVTAAVDHLASLAAPAGSLSRRERVTASMTAAHAYEMGVFARLLRGLAALDGVTVLPAPDHRCPTVSFRVDGLSPADLAHRLGDDGVCVFAGDYYAYEYFTAMGLRDSGGAVRAGIYHYNTDEDVDRLLAAVSSARRSPVGGP